MLGNDSLRSLEKLGLASWAGPEILMKTGCFGVGPDESRRSWARGLSKSLSLGRASMSRFELDLELDDLRFSLSSKLLKLVVDDEAEDLFQISRY